MDKEERRNFQKKVRIATGIVAATTLIILLFLKAVKVFLLVFAGIMVAIFFRSIAGWLSRKTGMPTAASLPISVVVVLALWTALVWVLEPKVSRQVNELSQKVPKAAQQLESNLEDSRVGRFVLDWIPFDLSSPGASLSSSERGPAEPAMKDDNAQKQQPRQSQQGKEDGISSLRKRLVSFFSTTLGILGNLYVILFFGAFFMANPKPYRQGIIALFPKRKRERIAVVYDGTGLTLRSWLFGKLLSMFVVFVLTLAGLWIMGIPLFITLALFAGLMSFIPNFGPLIAIVPAFLVSYVESPHQAIFVIILYVCVQFVESNLITPFIMKRQINVPFAMTLFSQLLLGYLVGGWGLIFATPIVAMIMVLIQMLYVEDILGDSDLDIKGERMAKERRED